MCLEKGHETMATSLLESPRKVATPTLQDLVDRLGGIPLSRILAEPAPGTASEADLIRINAAKSHLCELADGVLVEKAMGIRESLLAGLLIGLLRAFVVPRNLGIVTAPDGSIKLFPGLIRIPDVAFISWARIPGGRVPEEPVPNLAPDLVIEVLSKGNTKPEMTRKRREYFDAGVDLVWEVDPKKREVRVHRRGHKKPEVLHEGQTIECGPTLAGFRLVLADLFGELDRTQGTTKNA
jgi:Uma2 family endonuclease